MELTFSNTIPGAKLKQTGYATHMHMVGMWHEGLFIRTKISIIIIPINREFDTSMGFLISGGDDHFTAKVIYVCCRLLEEWILCTVTILPVSCTASTRRNNMMDTAW